MANPEGAKGQKARASEIAEISDEVLSAVIDLARLDPLKPGMALQKSHLKRILEQFRVLSAVDFEGADAVVQVNPTPIPLRTDEVKDWFTNDQALGNSRMRLNEFIRSPRIPGHEEQ